MVGEEVKDDSLYQLSSPETDHYKRALMDLELLIGEDQALLPAIRQLQTQLEVPGASIDCGNHDYFTGLQTSLDGIPFVGGCNQRWKRWKKMAPHAKHVWHDILQRKWQDPKLKPVHEFDYDQAHPCSPQEAAKMQQQSSTVTLERGNANLMIGGGGLQRCDRNSPLLGPRNG